jgi:DNA mismatch endonuclease (patch repair protein)
LRGPSTSRSNDAGDQRRRLTTFAGPRFAGREPVSAPVAARMARTGRRDTKPEIEIRRLLYARGLRYRVDQPVLEGMRRRADLVFRTARVAVFIDGCFWHGCPEHATWPKHNAEFWREKIEANRQRDRDTDRRLIEEGWSAVRVWEHQNAAQAANYIEGLVRSASPHALRSS